MKKTILLVEDTGSIRLLVQLTLQSEGYHVLTGVDGADALKHLDGTSIDLIITDLNMPNMNGITFIREVRTREDYKYIPIVLFTTEAESIKKKAREAGATGAIAKPFQKDELLTTVKKLIR